MQRRIPALLTLVVALAAVVLFTGCDKMWDAGARPGRVGIDFYIVNPPITQTIWAGQNVEAGSVTIWCTGTTAYLKFDVTGDWWLEQTHVAIAYTVDGIPQTKNGTPIPGDFPYGMTYDPLVKTYTYEIPWEDGWELDDHLVIAAHSVVVKLDEYGQIMESQTGWAGDKEGPGKRWWRYFEWDLKRTYKDVTLPPEGTVHMRGWHPNGDISYWRIELDVPDGKFDVWDSTKWRGWCAEQSIYMYPDHWYDVNLWSTLAPNLPTRCQNAGWDNVNWLLNNRPAGASIWDMEAAIWYLTGHGNHPTADPAMTMTDNAEAYGDGYLPPVGGWIAVIMESAADVQLCFIMVDP